MNFLESRVESFRNNTVKWPHLNKPHYKIETFACAGFYFVRRPKASDSVRCFLCDIEFSHWKPGESPYNRHTVESPNCPWTILNFPDTWQRILTANDVTTQPRSATMRSARLATFNNHNYWPPSKDTLSRKFQAASKLADAGFVYSPNLDNLARIKCPYCQSCILEPEKSMNALEKHKELNSSCIFFEQTHNIRPKSRRDTVTSSESTDTFKTASSKLSNSEETNKRKVGEITKPSSKQRKTEEIKSSSKDDNIWDFSNAFKTTIPSQVRKPVITFGKKTTARDRSRGRVLHSNAKQTGTVNIFSQTQIRPLPTSLVIKPGTSESIKEKAVSKVKSTLTEKSPLSLVEKPFSTPLDKPKVISSSDYFSDENEKPDSTVVIPPKKDKGKGRAVEPNFIASPLPTKKPISLSKSKPAIYTPALPTLIESSFSMRSPSMDSFNNIPSNPTREPSPIYDDTIGSSSPKRNSIQVEPSLDDVLLRTPATRAIMGEKIKYLQSTPVQSMSNTVSAEVIFGNCLFSPIVPQNEEGIIQSTPVIGGGRVRHVIDITQEELMDKRRISPPKSPNRNEMETPPVLSMDQIFNQVPPGHITEQEKKMKVEDYLQHVVDINISKIRQHGEELIEMIQEKSNQIKSQLLQQ